MSSSTKFSQHGSEKVIYERHAMDVRMLIEHSHKKYIPCSRMIHHQNDRGRAEFIERLLDIGILHALGQLSLMINTGCMLKKLLLNVHPVFRTVFHKLVVLTLPDDFAVLYHHDVVSLTNRR